MNRTIWTIHIFLNQEVVGNSDRTGDKTLNLQHFLTMSIGLSVEHIYYIAIAALACILGAEIAGICMLIGKLRRARSGELDLPDGEYDNNGRANYAVAALSFGAVSATAELALLVLAIAAAVGAFVLCLLLVVLYAKGYLLISAKTAKKAEQQEQAAQRAAQEAAARAAEEAAAKAAAEEEQALQDEYYDDNYIDDYEGDEAAQEAISNLIATEDAVMSEEYEEEIEEEVVEEIEEETVEEIEEEIVEAIEEEAEVVETAVVAQDSEIPVVHTVEHTVITEGAPAYAGQAPIIEKHIIETTKEIIKETNTTTVTEGKGEQFSPATEEMMKAITEFMKLETQLRMEREVAVEHPAEDGESTPAFAETEDEEVEADEIDAEDETDAEDEAEREADAEENDDDYESELFGNERIVGFDEETGCYIMARYRKSCEAKLMQSRPDTKKYYSAIRNALMGYEGTKERMSWTIDTYTNEHAQIAKINIRPRTLDLYLALEPSTLEDSVYRGKDVGGKKKYAETPFLYKVNSPRKLTLALELVQRACEEQGLSPIDIEEVNYEEQYPFTDTETLVARGLIREYLREEKPAATFELDPDHVPQLVEEDETVIPANANFTWEFDNDQPEQEEPIEEIAEEIVEEPVEEEVVEEEPIVEEPVAEETPVAPGTTTTTTVTHETIRTTERHYTERYYGNGNAAEVSEETRTFEVLPEPAEESVEAEAEEVSPEVEEAPVVEEVVEEIAEEALYEEVEEVVEETEAEPEKSQEEALEEEAIEEVEEEVVEEVIEEEPTEELEEEIIDDEIEEDIEETTAEQVAQIQSAVAALFGDDIFEDDEPIEEEPVEELVEEIEEEIFEEEEELAEEESIEETEPEEEITEEVEEIEEEVYEEESEVETEEEYYEEEPEVEAEEEEYYEEETEAVAEEEEYYEEEPEVEAEEEYYEEEPEAEAEEEYYEEEPEAEAEEEYYDEDSEEVYEDVEGEEFEEVYEEEVEEVFEEVEEEEEEPAPVPQPVAQPASDVVLLDVCLFDDYFDNGAIVNLETLKQVGLAPEGATRLKVYASGALKGQFTVEANHFTLDAIKAIGDADGDSIMIR